MFVEWGYVALLLLVVVSASQVLLWLWAEWRRDWRWLGLNRPLSLVQVVLGLFSFTMLVQAFLRDDFTFRYVTAHSNSQLPTFFKFAATWGGHEGSMLFWLAALCLWIGLFCLFSRHIDRLFAERTLAVAALIVLSFALFISGFSDPFERAFPPPPEGRDLNPMLQDIGLIIHPPLLYLGYVGFALTFAMSVATLLGGVFDVAIARWLRPWALIAWGFLTAGIMLGAWWAYYELGWGGWWFWDPVENASLMPWLLGTALLHSLVVSEQRGVFHYWTMLLAIFAFALSLLGTFIVRSGVLTSVHAFAIDTDRGIALLILFLGLSTVALSLFALRAHFWQGQVRFRLFSQEAAFLLLNGLFALATLVVVLGTFYPMLFSAMGWGAISVGAPYFNLVFTPLALLLMLTMGLATRLRWKQMARAAVWKSLLTLPFAFGMTYFLMLQVKQHSPAHSIAWLPTLFIVLACWLLCNHLPLLWKARHWRPLAMGLAHIGFALCVVGAMMNGHYGDEIGVRMKPGEEKSLAGFIFHYREFNYALGQNYTADVATIEVLNSNRAPLATLFPERRHYEVRTMMMAEVGLFHHGLDDLYVVMGERLGHETYAFRLHYKPYVRLLWLGGGLMAFAALFGVWGFRRQRVAS